MIPPPFAVGPYAHSNSENSTLDLVFHKDRIHHFISTGWTRQAFHATATVDERLFGVCPTAHEHVPYHSIVDNPKRKVFAATVAYEGQDMPWPKRVCIKFATGPDGVGQLARECQFYSYELRHLYGLAVPSFYGMYTGSVGSNVAACLVLELCTGTDVILKDVEEFNRLVMLAACRVHQAGILHRGLGDYHHFVMKDKSVYLVDFARAERHACRNGVPALAEVNYRSPPVIECWELYEAERRFGLLSGSRP
ncbi:hypothetical protein EWM64_g7751 [Hericium alpestre]|uniref:Protein kinase domain-containing protein n=1 Tax=Hericium alpestre TaxID=135208 RepID=A0A4Y9ZN92_9AGAM|nr:hypothetical protein EWM64_g7751 [Hericium alpestre]